MRFIFAVVLTFLSQNFALALEGKDGNGGAAWGCLNRNATASIRWVQLVDLFEAEYEFKLELMDFGNLPYREIVDKIRLKLLDNDKELFDLLNPYIMKAESRFNLIDGEPVEVKDSRVRVKPEQKTCPNGDIKYLQVANFLKRGDTLIRKIIWFSPLFSNLQKAALIIHEGIYEYAREVLGHVDSVVTREAVGLLFSKGTTGVFEKLRNKLHAFSYDRDRVKHDNYANEYLRDAYKSDFRLKRIQPFLDSNGRLNFKKVFGVSFFYTKHLPGRYFDTIHSNACRQNPRFMNALKKITETHPRVATFKVIHEYMKSSDEDYKEFAGRKCLRWTGYIDDKNYPTNAPLYYNNALSIDFNDFVELNSDTPSRVLGATNCHGPKLHIDDPGLSVPSSNCFRFSLSHFSDPPRGGDFEE